LGRPNYIFTLIRPKNWGGPGLRDLLGDYIPGFKSFPSTLWFIKIAVETQFEVADLDEIQDVFVSQYILVYRIVVENPFEVAELVIAVSQ